MPRPAVIKVKKEVLKRLDYETEVDPKVRSVVRSINSLPLTFTFGSCEGHPEKWTGLPYIHGISSNEELNILIECASKSDLKLKVNSPFLATLRPKNPTIDNWLRELYMSYNSPTDILHWDLHPKETEDWGEAHKKFARFQELVISYRLLLDD